jgi:hypothetical protein
MIPEMGRRGERATRRPLYEVEFAGKEGWFTLAQLS